MKTILLVCALVAFAAAVPAQLSVSNAMAARVDAQAWRVDRLTKQYQAISDAADAALNSAKEAGDAANHLLKYHLKGRSSPLLARSCPRCVSSVRQVV